MAVVHNSVVQYREDLSQWAIIRLGTDGSWERINPLADIDEGTLHGGHFFAEAREKIQGYQDDKSEVGAVLCVGVWRRLEEADTPALGAIWAEGLEVLDVDALNLRERQRYSEYLATGEATAEEVAAAQHIEQAVDPTSPGTVPGIGEPAEPDPDEGKEPEPDPEPEPTPEPQPPQVDYGPALNMVADGRYANGSSWFEVSESLATDNVNNPLVPGNWFANGEAHRFARVRFRADGKFRLYFRDNDGTNDIAGSGTSDPLVPDLLGKLGIVFKSFDGQTVYSTTLPEGAVKTNFYSWDEPVTSKLLNAVQTIQSIAQGGVATICLVPPGAEG